MVQERRQRVGVAQAIAALRTPGQLIGHPRFDRVVVDEDETSNPRSSSFASDLMFSDLLSS